MFVWNKISVTHSCPFDDAVREAFRLFPNVPEIKENHKKCLIALLSHKLSKLILPSKLFPVLLSLFLVARKVTIFLVMNPVLIGPFDITAVSQYLWA